MNLAILRGRLTADPELRHTESGTAVTSFTLAVDRPYSKNGEKIADFINVVAWRQTAEFVRQYFTKGQMMIVTGSVQTRRWEDKEGNKRTSVEIIANNVEFGEPKRDELTPRREDPPVVNQYETRSSVLSRMEEEAPELDDDDLPF